MHHAVLVQPADFWDDRVAAQPLVNHVSHVVVDCQAFPALNLHHHVEGGRRLALQHRLLRSAIARFLVAQRNGLDSPHQVRQRGVHNQVVQRVAVGRGDELHAPLGDGAGGGGLLLRAHFVNDDSLRHMVFHCLNHHAMLLRRRGNLHPPRPSDGRMGHVAVASDFVGGVNDDDPLLRFHRQHPRSLAEHGGLADARPSQQQNVLAGEG